MCYSEFNDIIEHIAAMDADVITIECSRSQMELLNVFADRKLFAYSIYVANIMEVFHQEVTIGIIRGQRSTS